MTWYSSLGIVKLSRTSLGLWSFAPLAARSGVTAARDTDAGGFAFFAARLVTGATPDSATVAAASAVSVGLLTLLGTRLVRSGLAILAMGFLFELTVYTVYTDSHRCHSSWPRSSRACWRRCPGARSKRGVGREIEFLPNAWITWGNCRDGPRSSP